MLNRNNFMQNARNNLCKKQWTIFMRKQWIVLINAENRFYECSKQIWIYNKYDVQRTNFINVETHFINAENKIRLLWNSNMKKHSDLVFKSRKHDFIRCFMRKQWTIYAEKRVNKFSNNTEHKIILCKVLEIVYAENSEQFLWENNEQF